MHARILTCILCLCNAVAVYAQLPRLSTRDVLTQGRTYQVSTIKSVPERIFPTSLTTLECADTSATVYSFTADDAQGFPFGSGTIQGLNVLGTVQRFKYPVGQPYQVSEVGVAFAVADSTAANQRLSARIYNDLSADSTFGTLLAISDTISVSDILLPANNRIQYTTFTFPLPAVVERDSFWVYIDASDIYEGIEGDVAIISTTDSCGFGRNAFVDIGGSGGRFLASVDEIYGLEVELYINATVDTNITVSLLNSVVPAQYELVAFPNPASDFTTIQFTPTHAGRYAISVVDAQGRTIEQQTYDRLGAGRQIRWTLTDLPVGLLFFHVDGPEGRQSKKLLAH